MDAEVSLADRVRLKVWECAEFRRKSPGLEPFPLACQLFIGKVYFKNLIFNIICHYFHFATKKKFGSFYAHLAGLRPLPFFGMRPQAGKFSMDTRLKTTHPFEPVGGLPRPSL